MSDLQEKQLIKTIVCPAKDSDFNPKLGGESTLQYKASIAAAKSAVTKLTKNLNGYAPFYFIDNFFKDPTTKKVQGPVLVMGKEKKVLKHFVNVEMKSGKLDQSSAANQKEAATGRVYAKQTETGLVLCFEPHPKCKIPGAKWPKIFKALKPCLKGLKCELVEPSAAAVAEAAAEEAGGTATNATAGGFDEAQLKNLATIIKQGLQSTAGLIARIKAGEATTEEDLSAVQILVTNIGGFKTMYGGAPTEIQPKYQTFYTQVTKQEGSLNTLITRLGGNTEEEEGIASQASGLDIDELLKITDNMLAKAEEMQVSLNEDFVLEEVVEIPGGEAFISIMES